MATVAHIIRSDYDPEVDRERLQRETGQAVDPPAEEEPDPWQTQSPFGVRRRLIAPQFVPAALSYDEWGNALLPVESVADPSSSKQADDVAGWYKSLARQGVGEGSQSSSSLSSVKQPPSSPSHPSAPALTQHSPIPQAARRNERDWFIHRVLSHPSSASPTPAPPATLAEILSRDPPTKRPHQPPVFLHLGPSNRGWAMLQSRGWSEGEGLGSGIARRADLQREDTGDDAAREDRRSRKRAKVDGDRARPQGRVKHEERDIALDVDIVEVRRTPVIDLTVSESESESESEEDDDDDAVRSSVFPTPGPSQPSAEAIDGRATQTALLTPIPTVLKSDRLGIGLKAKTEGPYKSSVKRVTHNAAALAAHEKAAEELRRTKKLLGKGRRAFEKQERKERQRRQDMMAYLNAA
ncbi:hypothetical protein BV25DRAFT_1826523 [Artomyces pyxidatus]|uniref:Uncharacterized protein n=1 Tax=Artomyces pyxidatus TaxID=48021 RepID=A0ACB8SY80_9AGAM|nr:hypothetical protein BV25DRAFT_1826523 [Artomyces pyxidatus]